MHGNYEDISKLMNIENNYKVKCKCGTKAFMVKADKVICRGCGRYVYRTSQIEFREKLKERLKKMNNDLLAEKYHNEIEQKYNYDLKKIDREEYDELLDEYKKLEKKYFDLEAGHQYFIENIKELVRNGKISDIAEFIVGEGISL